MKFFALSAFFALHATIATASDNESPKTRQLRQGPGASGFSGQGGFNGSSRGGFGGRGGIGGRIPGFEGFEPVISTIQCPADDACSLRNGDDGVLVCRTMTHPLFGTDSSRTKCISPDEAYERDVCGCCDGQCSQLDFVTLTCADDTQPSLTQDIDFDFKLGHRGRPGHGRPNEESSVICREITHPFTGESNVPVTLLVPDSRGLLGDECGCCEEGCPELEAGPQIEPPPFVEKSCVNDVEYETCRPRRGRPGRPGDGPDDEEGDDEEEGFFVCRTTYNAFTGEENQRPVCITSDTAWETDECGCCGEECPSRPELVELTCDVLETEPCTLRRGEEGFFACRTIYNPFNGEENEVSVCISGSHALPDDVCGCCDPDGCPVTPSNAILDTMVYDEEEFEELP